MSIHCMQINAQRSSKALLEIQSLTQFAQSSILFVQEPTIIGQRPFNLKGWRRYCHESPARASLYTSLDLIATPHSLTSRDAAVVLVETPTGPLLAASVYCDINLSFRNDLQPEIFDS